MKVTITTIDNGWLVTYPSPADEYTKVCYAVAYSEWASDREQAEAERDLLWVIKEGLGLYNSKHKPFNVGISVIELNDEDDKEEGQC